MQYVWDIKRCIVIIVLLGYVAYSQTRFPLIINYQGTLTGDTAGKSNSATILFSLYENQLSKIPLWKEEHENVVITNKMFNVELGSIIPFGGLAFNKQYWLGIVFDGMEEFRIKLTASPYAFTANTVSGHILGGVEIENNLLVKSVNGLNDNVVLKSGKDLSITKEGNSLTFAYTGTGGGILNADTGSVTSELIDSGAVTAEKIDSNAVTSSKIAPSAVGTDKIAASAVTSNKIADGSVTTSKIADNAVDGTKISIGTASQDILVYNAAGNWSALSKGAIGQVLKVGAGGDLEWAADASSSGGIITGNGSGTVLNGTVIDLGGNLNNDVTTITQDGIEEYKIANTGTGKTIIDLTSTGTFEVQDGGAASLIVNGSGVTTAANFVATTADVNGGTIDGTSIGATTASSGAFTTLASSGNATVGGTLGVTGASTFGSSITATGIIQSGVDGTDGSIKIYSEQGGADYTYSVVPHAAATQNVVLTLPADDGTSGQFLATDGSGALSWASSPAVATVIDADGDTKIQAEEAADEDKIRFDIGNGGTPIEALVIDPTGFNFNTAAGYIKFDGQSMISNKGTKNTLLGFNAGINSTTGQGNTFVGDSAGNANTSGSGNVFIGKDAGIQNTIGISNIFIGENSGKSNTSGNGNTGVGQNTFYLNNLTGIDNVAIGSYAGSRSDGANGNLFAGVSAGEFNESGDYNTYIGYKAGNIGIDDSYNVYVGKDAGRYAKLADSNLFIGVNAGSGEWATEVTASNSIIMGFNAGARSVDADNSLIIGNQAGYYLGDADYNIIQGFEAGKGDGTTRPSGDNNLFIGNSSGTVFTTAAGNTVLGNNSALALTSGSNNTVLGLNAGDHVTTGANNILIGYKAGDNITTGSNNIVIGYDVNAVSAVNSNQIHIGNIVRGCEWFWEYEINASIFAKNSNRSSGNIRFYENSTNGTNYAKIQAPILAADYTLTLPVDDGTGGQVLTTDGSGTLTWSSGAAASNIIDADGDTKIQAEEAADEDKLRFDVGGYEALIIDNTGFDFKTNTGAMFIKYNGNKLISSGVNNNLFLGNNAGVNIGGAATDNTYIGYNAGAFATTGNYNTAIGSMALQGDGSTAPTTGSNVVIGTGAGQRLTSGGSHVFIGMASGQNNTTGGSSVFIGEQSGYDNTTGNNNVYIGQRSGRNTSSGSNNVALGAYALQGDGTLKLTGSGNTAIGDEAGKLMTTGAQNILIGYHAGDNITSGSTNIIIGYDVDAAVVTGNSQLNIGNLITGDLAGKTVTVGGVLSVNNGATSAGKIQIFEDSDAGSQSVTLQAVAMLADYTLTFPTTDGASSEFLQTDGNGVLSWASAASASGSGTTLSGSAINLGGTLSAAATIVAGAYDITLNLNSTGDFVVQSSGTEKFKVDQAGDVYIGGVIKGNSSGNVVVRVGL